MNKILHLIGFRKIKTIELSPYAARTIGDGLIRASSGDTVTVEATNEILIFKIK